MDSVNKINFFLIQPTLDNVLLINTRSLSIVIDKPMSLSIVCPNLQNTQPSHEPVNQLIEFGMSVDDLHTNHDENRFMCTVEDVQSEPDVK